MADTTPQTQQTPQQQALVRARRDLGGLIQGQEFRDALAAVLPKHCTAERFARMVLTATMRVPDLLKCSRESFFKCCFDLSALGLEPDGRRAHLIPRKTGKKCSCGDWQNQHQGSTGACTRCECRGFQQGMECTLVVDYKGLVDLVRRSGEVAYIHADVVYDKDEWDFCYGSEAFLKHKPNLKDGGGAGVVAIYSFVKLKDGTEDFIVLSRQDVEKVRAVSPAGNDGPWVTWWGEMAKKTAFRRHSKWLPFSSELREAIEKDDEYAGSADTTTADNPTRVTLNLDAFRPSEDEHRGHDESMETGSPAKTAASEKPQQQEPEPEKPQPQQTTATSVHRGPVKTFAKGEMPDAMDMRLGFECYNEGRHFRVAEDGDLQKWVDIGAAPEVAAEPAEESPDPKLAAAPRGRGGRGNKPADAFDFNSK